MLTKDLIICRSTSTSVYPKFISPKQQEFLELASQFLAVYESAAGRLTRGELEEQLLQMGNACGDPKVAVGLQKLLDDRAVYASQQGLDYPEERRRVFLAGASALRQADGTEEAYRETVCRSLTSPLLESGSPLYADLPDNDLFCSLKAVSPAELLEIYNCAQVQGLLLFAKKMELELEGISIANLRRLLGAVRMHRLVCDIREMTSKTKIDEHEEKDAEHGEKCGENANKFLSVRLLVDGPSSVLSQARSYGLQLALFFPMVCAMPHWKLRADIFWKNGSHRLDLDEHSRLCVRNMSTGYEPEEYQVFRDYFSSRKTEWQLLPDIDFIRTHTGELIVPDFVFRRSENEPTLMVELFHRWHASMLKRRLNDMDAGLYPQLIIGVDKAIASGKEVAELLENSSAFRQRGFLFRDFPNADRLRQILMKVQKL